MLHRRALALLLLTTASCGLSVVGLAELDGGDGGAFDAGHSDAELADAATPDTVDASNDASADARADADAEAGKPALVFGPDCVTGTVYDDDFSTDPAARWTQVSGTWTWDPVAQTYATTIGLNPLYALAWIGARPKWTDYSVEVTFTGAQFPGSDHGDMGAVYRIGDVGDAGGGPSAPPPINVGAMYMSVVSINTDRDALFSFFQNGVYTNADGADAAPPVDKTKSLTLHVDVDGSSMKTFVNGEQVLTDTDTKYPAGSIGLRAFQGTFVIHRVRVTCHG